MMGFFDFFKVKEEPLPEVAYLPVVGLPYHEAEELLDYNECFDATKSELEEYGDVRELDFYGPAELVVETEGKYVGAVRVYSCGKWVGYIAKDESETARKLVELGADCTINLQGGRTKMVDYYGDVVTKDTEKMECILTAKYFEKNVDI